MTQKSVLAVLTVVVGFFFVYRPAHADPSKYPQFAQQTLPPNVTPSFISIDELLAELKAGKKPLIIDVRSAEEYREAHIAGALSAPLTQFNNHVKTIPKEGLVVLY